MQRRLLKSKKDAKIQAKRIWNPSKEGFEIQTKKDFEIHVKNTLKSMQVNFWNSKKTIEIQRRMIKSKQRGFEIQAKKDFEIQAKKDFEIHTKKTFET